MQRLEQGWGRGEYAQVWAEELVGRAHPEISTTGLDIGEHVRRGVHPVDPEQGSRLVYDLCDGRQVRAGCR